MLPPSTIDRAALKERVSDLRDKLLELQAGCLERGAMTRREFGEFSEITAEFEKLRREFLGDLPEVQALMGGKVLTAADYKEHLGLTVEPEGPLPATILEVLQRECPVNGPGHRVKDTHLLAWIPKEISLTKLSQAVGGRAGKVLFDDWFINHESGIGERALSEGKWVLLPNRCPEKAKNLNWDDSQAALNANYPVYKQADALSFSAALVLNCVKNGERWYASEYGWCSDRLGSASGALALPVGCFNADGLSVVDENPDAVSDGLGAACFWNFGTR